MKTMFEIGASLVDVQVEGILYGANLECGKVTAEGLPTRLG